MKKSIITSIFIGLLALCGASNASAWIGTGTSGGGGGGGGSGGCGGEIDKYGIGCAGVSWAYYQAQGETGGWTEFPYINSGLRVSGASIPPECSKQGGGFWHFGINSFGAYIADGEIWTTTAEWAREFGSPWWGHWLTINPGNSVTSWAPYKTSGVGARQWVGVYQMNHFGSWNEALKAYQEAYVYEHPGSSKPGFIPGDVWGFCWGPYMQEVTLTVKSIDTNGNSLSTKMADKTSKGAPGTERSVTIGNIPGYTKLYWGNSTNPSTWWSDTSMTYKETISSNKTIYAVYVKDQYQGNSQVAQIDGNWNSIPASQKKSTGYTQSNATATQVINNCNPVNGCTAKFWHNLKRIAGSGSTTFNITRTSNYYTIGSGTVLSTRTETFSSGNEVNERTEAFTNKLYPGQKVCETLTFDANIDAKNIKTTACAIAPGPAQPTGSDASLNIKVKNQNTTNTYQQEVYAKPGDRLSYLPTYTPTLQYTYRLIPEQYRINSGTIRNNNSGANLNNLFNTINGCNSSTTKCWKNAFSVQRSKLNNGFESEALLVANYTYGVGQTIARSPEQPPYTVLPSDVGHSVDERAITNLNSSTQTTPSQVTFTLNSGKVLADVNTSSIFDVAYARIPYNYINTTEVTSNESNTILYAGESVKINYKYIINPKINLLTTKSTDSNRAYTTTVGDPRWHLELCVGQAQCDNNIYSHLTSDKTPTNEAERAKDFTPADMWQGKVGDNAITKETTINIPDVSAGTRVCVRSAVFPATSSADNNWQNKSGDGNWAYSVPQCFAVAKKPSLQIWGGNTYTRTDINTATAIKGHLSYEPYQIEPEYDTKHVFGSWTELGLIASDSITGFSSGASLGYASNINGSLSPNPFDAVNNNNPLVASPGSSNQTSLCNRSPLTFANSPCTGSGQSGSLGNTSATNLASDNKNSILDKLVISSEINAPTDGTTPINLNTSNYYNSGNSNLVISEFVIAPATTQLAHSSKNIAITGNLTYANTPYSKFSDMSKLVVYAEGDINIACNVTHIDAILIANGKVNTCADVNGANPDLNSRERSTQLVINGAIISSSLIPSRTYGAATGANSIVPAETINYDPTLYLWGGNESQTSGTTNNNLDITYHKELAPRR